MVIEDFQNSIIVIVILIEKFSANFHYNYSIIL